MFRYLMFVFFYLTIMIGMLSVVMMDTYTKLSESQHTISKAFEYGKDRVNK